MEMSEAWPHIYDEGYIFQFQPEPTHKIHQQQQNHWLWKYAPVELSKDHEDHSNQHKNSLNLCDEMRHKVLSLIESQWKLRQIQDQNFQMEAKPL